MISYSWYLKRIGRTVYQIFYAKSFSTKLHTCRILEFGKGLSSSGISGKSTTNFNPRPPLDTVTDRILNRKLCCKCASARVENYYLFGTFHHEGGAGNVRTRTMPSMVRRMRITRKKLIMLIIETHLSTFGSWVMVLRCSINRVIVNRLDMRQSHFRKIICVIPST